MVIDEHDLEQGYCRMLGHRLSFGYCRVLRDGMPCHRLHDCWFESFPIQDFVRRHYTREQIDAFLTPPPPKLLSLLELMEQAAKKESKE